MLRQLVKVVWFYVGLIICVFGYSLVIKPGVGAAPWDILHLGITGRTGIPLAFVVQGVGAAIIGLNLLLGIRPSLGMVLNMLSVGPIMQFFLTVIPRPEAVLLRWLMFAVGIFISGLGTGLYASADLGTGPRDGMMIGLTRRLGLPVGIIKNVIDVTVAASGWLLGGPLGVGTVAVAILLGPSMQIGMWLTRRLSEIGPFSAFVRPVALKKPA